MFMNVKQIHVLNKNDRKSYLFNIFIAVVIILVTGSCNEECHFKPRSRVLVNFHSVVNSSDVHAAVDSLTVRGLGREDSLLYNAANNIRTISMPLDGNSTESGFIFDFDRGSDTIWLSYIVRPWFLSPECGFVLNFDLTGTRHTTNVVDSVVIVVSEVTTFDDTNIRIYN